MTKTLTEQWRDGTLREGWYYLKVKSELANYPVIAECVTTFNCQDCYSYFYDYDEGSIEEVLAPVPSYEEYKELLHHSELSRNLVYEVLVNQKEYNELLDKAKEYKRLQELLSQEEDRIRSLLERIGEADKIIKYYAEKHGKLKACYYLNKWGVK